MMNEFAMMQRLYLSEEISDEQRCHLNFALAKANEDLGNFEAAYCITSKAMLPGKNYWVTQLIRTLRHLKKLGMALKKYECFPHY